MTQPFMKGEHWGLPHNRTPDRETFGGHAPERRSPRGAGRDGGWRGVVFGVAIVASLASGLVVGRLSAAAQPLSDGGQVAPRPDLTTRLLDTNGSENPGR